MKWTFQLALHERMKADERIMLLYCDIGGVMFADIIRAFPERAINMGVMEQATISFAAGLAMAGLRPVVYSITPFLIERAFEQIKLDVDQMNLPVGIVGYSDDECGPTHQCLSPAKLAGLFKNIQFFQPAFKSDVTEFIQKVSFEFPFLMPLGPEAVRGEMKIYEVYPK